MKAFGERLKQAREAQAIPIQTVAASTRIRERYLHALEQCDLDTLPGGVFDKGYIKAYAEFLGIDPAPLLESYAVEERKSGRGTPEAEREKLDELARLVRAGPLPTPVPMRARVLPLIVLVGLVLAVTATVWLLVISSPTPTPSPPEREPLSEESSTVTRSLTTPEPVGDATTPPPEPSLSVPQLGVGTGIEDRNLVGRNDRFPDGSKVWFWTRIVGGGDGDSVRHVWRHAGRIYMDARLPVGGSHWRTYSTLELPPGTVGEWSLTVVDANAVVLAQKSFVSVSPDGGT